MTNTGNDWMRTTATDELGAIDAEPHITGAVLWRNCRICLRARNRIKAGWPEDLAYSMPAVPHGYTPVKGKFPRKRKAA